MATTEADRNPATRGYVSALLRGVAEGLTKTLRSKFDGLEERIAALETRPAITYEGVHAEGKAYVRGQCVTHGGSVWIVRAGETTAKPGASSDWQLCVRRGNDGRDAK